MNAAFRVQCGPRAHVDQVLSRTPLITIAWRSMQAELLRRADQARQETAQADRLRSGLADIAEQVYSLKTTENPSASAVSAATRVLEILERLGITVLDAQGEPFTPEKMEWWENTAQRMDPQTDNPWIAEIIKPAIRWKEDLLRMGKAVIAVPDRREDG